MMKAVNIFLGRIRPQFAALIDLMSEQPALFKVIKPCKSIPYAWNITIGKNHIFYTEQHRMIFADAPDYLQIKHISNGVGLHVDINDCETKYLKRAVKRFIETHKQEQPA